MATQQELLDTVYQEFTQGIGSLGIKADTPATQVVGELILALKRVVNSHGATAITVDSKKYTAREALESYPKGEA